MGKSKCYLTSLSPVFQVYFSLYFYDTTISMKRLELKIYSVYLKVFVIKIMEITKKYKEENENHLSSPHPRETTIDSLMDIHLLFGLSLCEFMMFFD